PFVHGVEAGPRRGTVTDRGREGQAHRVGQRLFGLRARTGLVPRRQRRGTGDQQPAAAQRHVASLAFSEGSKSALAITLACASRRPWYSTLPSFRPRSEIT